MLIRVLPSTIRRSLSEASSFMTETELFPGPTAKCMFHYFRIYYLVLLIDRRSPKVAG